MMSWPNRITIARILLLPVFVALLLQSDEAHWLRYAAMGVFAAMALCDFLDGQLARRLRQRTALGTILDPIADKLVLTVSVIILTYPRWPGYETDLHIPRWVTVTILSKDAFVVIGVFILHLLTGKSDLVNPSRLGKWATALTFLLVLLTLVGPDTARWLSAEGMYLAFLVGFGGVVALLSAVACLDYIRIGSKTLAHHRGEEHI